MHTGDDKTRSALQTFTSCAVDHLSIGSTFRKNGGGAEQSHACSLKQALEQDKRKRVHSSISHFPGNACFHGSRVRSMDGPCTLDRDSWAVPCDHVSSF